MQLFRFQTPDMKKPYEFKSPTLQGAVVHIEARFGRDADSPKTLTVREDYSNPKSPFVSCDKLYRAEKADLDEREKIREANEDKEKLVQQLSAEEDEKLSRSFLPKLEPAPPAYRVHPYDRKR